MSRLHSLPIEKNRVLFEHDAGWVLEPIWTLGEKRISVTEPQLLGHLSRGLVAIARARQTRTGRHIMEKKQHTEVARLCLQYGLRILIIADITGGLPSKLPVSTFLLTLQQKLFKTVFS